MRPRRPPPALGSVGRLMSVRFRWVASSTVVLSLLFLGTAWLESPPTPDRLPRELLLTLANTAPLLLVTRQPLVVVLALAVTYPTWIFFGHPTHELQALPTIVAMFMLGAWDRPLRLRAVGLVTPLWMVVGGASPLWGADLLGLTFVGLFMVAAWALAVALDDGRRRAEALEVRTTELAAAREELAEQAVQLERSRIARELHDVIAHAMSVITVQAGVGAHLIDRRPRQAADALRVIERTGRDALLEMRRMLTMLRGEEIDEAGTAPQPRLAELDDLVAAARDAGVNVTCRTLGDPRPLPAGLELAAYRVVQEGLTNISKHATTAAATVTVDHRPAELMVTISNDLPDLTAPPTGPAGHGLRGMKERVALYGGELGLETIDGSFTVTARFPTEGDER
jgi:signal transduction histidine kinase